MDAAFFLMTHPEIKHGTIKILFTPDEEIGRGVDKVDLKKLGAHYAYTIDGETVGHIENETFSADMMTIEFFGVSIHPGYAKGKMENAIKIAAAVIDSLPKEHTSPETTSGREGFVHPVSVSGTIEKATLKLIIRSFETPKLKEYEEMTEGIVKKVMERFPKSTYKVTVTEQYRNFREVLDKHPQVIEYAMEAVRLAGLEPKLTCIRGGTDGSRLSFMGLPCPNIFAGEHAFHGKQEWVSVQDMQKAVETIIRLCMIWEEKSN
jgi:tripeptide aminopeptidase